MNAIPPVICRVCGMENRPTRLFCSNCGSYLQAEGEDTWEELPVRSVAAPVGPPTAQQPASFAIADGWSVQAATQSTHAAPAEQRRNRGPTRIVGIVLLLLLLGVAAALGALVYATLFSGGDADGGGGVVTSTTARMSTSSTTGGISGSTTSSAVPGTTLARGDSISPTTVDASSVLVPDGDITYGPDNMFDGLLETAWQEGAEGSGVGEWVRFDFGGETTLSSMEVANGYQKDDRRFFGNPRVETLRIEYSDGTTQQVRLYDDTGFQEITPTQIATASLRLTILSVYPGDTWDDAGFSEVRLYEAAQ